MASYDNRAASKESYDPYDAEPIRHPLLQPSSKKPFNAEPPLPILAESFITPNELFYVRNHLHAPDISADDFELEVVGCGGGGGISAPPLALTLDDVKRFPKVTVTSTIQCGGNRRAEMLAVKHLKGLEWRGAAIGNATWSGARLFDVLSSAGLTDEVVSSRGLRHVHFDGYDTGADGAPYGASVPIEKAFDPRRDVLLAYEMNGEPLPRDHGFPLRVVVPGVVGARNVKWLNRITVSEAESGSHWQQKDYKGFNPSVDWDTVDFSTSPAIQDMPVTSAICQPQQNDVVKRNKDGKVHVKGYAYSGGGQKIIRVDLTADGGETWIDADIDDQDSAPALRHYGWTLWSASVPVPDGADNVEIWSKAVDSGYNVQPESFENIWNLRGLLSNAYFKLKLRLQK